jgi:ABC-2 type transport system permease protein
MSSRAYIWLVWRNHRAFALFSMAFITLQDIFFNMLSYDGAAAFGLNHPIVLTLLVINAISIPAHHISRELESGTLELLLAHPVKRSALLVSLWVAGGLIFLSIIIAALLGSSLSIIIFHKLTSAMLIHLLEIGFNLWLLISLIFTMTIMIAVFSKAGFKSGNASAGITFFFYLLFFLAQLWSTIAYTNYFNIFNYYQPQKIMFGQGNFLRDIMVLSMLIVVCLWISIKKFGKRDLP